MNTLSQIEGQFDPRFKAVREIFAENFAKRHEVGAAVCVYLAGKSVVDLWGGYADVTRTRLWNRDTIVNVASTTKGMVALCAHILVERGLLDLNAPVAHYWPEFVQANKAQIPVRWLLSHRAGLPAIRQDMPQHSLFNWQTFIQALEETEPWWVPGTQHGYHALTFGYLVGEVIRRISGKSVGQFLHTEVAEPLGADFFIGVPEAQDTRAAVTIPDLPPLPGDKTILDKILSDPTSMTTRVFTNPSRGPDVRNTRAWRAAEIPATNGHTTARALARIYGTLANGGMLDGIRLLQPTTIDAAIVEQASGPDAVLSFPTRFGLGFMLTVPKHWDQTGYAFPPFGPNPRTFGHPGAGGSVGFADLDAQIGFGYVMNQYQTGTPQNPDFRWTKLVKAIYKSLDAK